MQKLRFTSLFVMVCSLAVLSASANSGSNVPKRVVKDTVAYCAEIEIEYRKVGQTQEEYLLECVNEHLELEGQETITSIE